MCNNHACSYRHMFSSFQEDGHTSRSTHIRFLEDMAGVEWSGRGVSLITWFCFTLNRYLADFKSLEVNAFNIGSIGEGAAVLQIKK